MRSKPTFVIVTLGCKVNQYDSWAIARELKALGFDELSFGSEADVYIVDTCTVTHVADAKSRKTVKRARRFAPNGVVVVTGCAATLSKRGEGSTFDVADLIADNNEKDGLAKRIAGLVWKRWGKPGQESTPAPEEQVGRIDGTCRVRAMLKAQDGCDKFCSFCIIPFTRGQPRSKRVDKVIEEAKELVDLGYAELVLTGVCLGMYGQDLNGGNVNLAHLLERLNNVDGVKRIRMSSLDPRDITSILIESAAALPKVCDHMHISLQSGDDEILKAMRRGYTCSDYHHLIDKIRASIPDAAITTDIMVGFPGETKTYFENTCRFVEQIGFAQMHIFRYSTRPGTIAALVDKPASPPEAEERSRTLLNLSGKLYQRYASRFAGSQLQVLVETTEAHDDHWKATGLSSNYLRVAWESKIEPTSASLEPVRIDTIGRGVVRGSV